MRGGETANAHATRDENYGGPRARARSTHHGPPRLVARVQAIRPDRMSRNTPESPCDTPPKSNGKQACDDYSERTSRRVEDADRQAWPSRHAWVQSNPTPPSEVVLGATNGWKVDPGAKSGPSVIHLPDGLPGSEPSWQIGRL